MVVNTKCEYGMALAPCLYGRVGWQPKMEDEAVFRVKDQATESALCVGIMAAVVWGIGLSLYGYQQAPGQLSWIAWGVQLIAGVLACLVMSLALVRGREWVVVRLQATSQELQEQR